MIDVENVTKTYQRGAAEVRALRGLSCQIPPGVLTFVVGPSGSGKSSLLYILGALDQPTSGEVTCRGQRLTQLTVRQRDVFRRVSAGHSAAEYHVDRVVIGQLQIELKILEMRN